MRITWGYPAAGMTMGGHTRLGRAKRKNATGLLPKQV